MHGTNKLRTNSDVEARARARLEAMDACTVCNHSGYILHPGGRLEDCVCAAPFRGTVPPLVRMDGEDMHPDRRGA